MQIPKTLKQKLYEKNDSLYAFAKRHNEELQHCYYVAWNWYETAGKKRSSPRGGDAKRIQKKLLADYPVN